MREVLITGHRNPDMDSVCSAYAYAELKNKLSQDGTHYRAIRCGHLNNGQKKHFEEIGITPPPYMRDVYPKVGDVMRTAEKGIQATAPIYDLVKEYKKSQPSTLPIFSGEVFEGLLSVDDITAWFLNENTDHHPVYLLSVANMQKVLHARVIYQGKRTEMEAPIVVSPAELSEFSTYFQENPESVVIMPYREAFVKEAVRKNIAAVVITTATEMETIDFSGFDGVVMTTEYTTAEAIRKLRMAPEIQTIMSRSGLRLQVTDTFDEAKDLLSSSSLRGLPVFDGESFAGFVTRRCFLDKPKYKVILTDHNEPNQSIRGIETAEVCEIIDHHRLDAVKTNTPIYIDAEPVGSTCTIVYQQYLRSGITPSRDVAIMLLTGILSDTVILKSPTTTQVDREAAQALATLYSVEIQDFGMKMFSNVESLSARDPRDAVLADFKTYTEKGVKMGIAQCEVTTLKDLDSYKETYLSVLEKLEKENHLDWVMLMISDVLREKSVLLTTENKYLKKLAYQKMESKIYEMPGVLSRKKQLLPAVIHALELATNG